MEQDNASTERHQVRNRSSAMLTSGPIGRQPGLFGGVALGNLVGGVATAWWLRRAIRADAGHQLRG